MLVNTRYRAPCAPIADLIVPGVEFGEILRTNTKRGYPKAAAGNVEQWIAERLERHRQPSGSFEQHFDDERWFRITERRTSDGGTVGIWSDITERRMAEQQLWKYQRLEAVGQLTGGIAHEFNNLLAIIVGSIEMLAEQTKGGALDLTKRIERAAFRGSALTQQLLAFARKQPLRPTAIEPAAALASRRALTENTIGETIGLTIEASPAVWSATADASQLEVALLNLVINARDALPRGGTIAVHADNVTLDATAARRCDIAPGRYIAVEVADTGEGMTAEVADRAVEPFFTTKDVGKGTGLGLSMVHDFIKQSGGHMEIESKVGTDTTVHLLFPAASEAKEVVSTPAPRPAARADIRVLVVEDDADALATAAMLIHSLGYGAIEAADGPAALAAMAIAGRIDVLATDVVMPKGMSGLALAEAARARQPGLPVIYTTGYGQNAIAARGPIGQDIVLIQKPLAKADLARVLAAAADPLALSA